MDTIRLGNDRRILCSGITLSYEMENVIKNFFDKEEHWDEALAWHTLTLVHLNRIYEFFAHRPPVSFCGWGVTDKKIKEAPVSKTLMIEFVKETRNI